MNEVFALIGKIALLAGVTTAAALGIFRFLAEKWVENRFAKELESFKHQQAREIQKLRGQIDSMLSGALKIQEKEFAVLPEAWEKLNEFYGWTTYVVSPMQQYPDLEKLQVIELEEFLAASELPVSKKQEILAASPEQRNRAYATYISRLRLHKAQVAQNDFTAFVARNGVFLTAEMKSQCDEIAKILRAALISFEVGKQYDNNDLTIKGSEQAQTAAPLYDAIEAAIAHRLRSHSKGLGEDL